MKLKEISNRTISWSFKKTALIMLGILLLGASIGTAETVEVEKEVVREVYKDDAEWRNLKEVDDEALGYCAEASAIASESFGAISRMDVATLELKAQEMSLLAPLIEDVAVRRAEALNKLGY